MASIPLPALGIKPPESPLDQFSKLAAIRAMGQEAQQRGLQIQQQQQSLKDQQAVTAAYKAWDGKDPNQLGQLVMDNGGSGNARMAIQQHYLGLKKTYSDIAAQDATTGSKNIETLKQKNDMALGAINAAEGVPDEQLAQHLSDTVSSLSQKGLLDQQHQQAATALIQGLQSGQLAPKDARAQLDLYKKDLQSNSAQIDQATKEAQANKDNQQGNEAAQRAKLLQMQMEYYQKRGLAPGIPLDVQEAQDWLAKNPGKGPADFMTYKAKLVPQFNFNLQNSGAAGAPGKPSAIAQGIADGSIKWNDAVSARTPMAVKQALLAEVKGINPAFKSSDFDVEKKVQEAFTSGNYSQQLNSINRAREHMQTFLDAARDLDNGNVQAFNKVGNMFSVQFGSDKVGNLNIAKQAFSSEVGKAFAGSSVGVTDREELNKSISAASSFQQLAGAARTADTLLAGAQKALKTTYGTGMKAQPNFGTDSAAPQVPPAAAGMVNVQLKDGRTGTIKADQLNKFLSDNPGSSQIK